MSCYLGEIKKIDFPIHVYFLHTNKTLVAVIHQFKGFITIAVYKYQLSKKLFISRSLAGEHL